MTIRQKILKAFYPALTGITQLFGRHDRVLKNEKQVRAPHSFYDLTLVQNNGDPLPLSAYKGKKVLLVNTASDCGYTAQYDDLQQLYETYKDKLVVIGFPANDFKEQEKGSDEEIAKFCRLNFGVSFPLAKKSSVRRGEEQNPVFRWLTDKQYNGWNDRAPVWNFTKYLVNEEGMLTAYFEPSVSPLSETVVGAVKK
ncbi:MAG: glutathione peroxidase [Terrimonas sp.]|nr:glutathione peroxidase [Terrimonas sp.]